MGFLNTIKSALGLQKPLQVRVLGPFGFTDAAKAALAELDEGDALHIETTEAVGGRLVQVEPCPPQGPPPPGYEGLAITVSDADLELLNGLKLDFRNGRWAVSLALEVRARETPNPDGRLYLVDRALAVGPPAFFGPDAPAPPLAERLLAIEGVRSVLLRDNTVTVERVADTPWDDLDRSVDAALRQYFLMCGKPVPTDRAVLPTGDGFHAEVLQVLQERILPGVHADGGDIQLMGIEDGIVRVHMAGACRSCPASTMTLSLGVERALKEAFGDRIRGVESV